jgi:hypothetical protein
MLSARELEVYEEDKIIVFECPVKPPKKISNAEEESESSDKVILE